ncbi:MAG: alpha-glucosidase [Bacteroidia bacterium]|nr:alpha-glucosidase [Bacteroidia bacterium]
MQRNWWKESFVYQIYPRSFMDSNGDGIGDIPGITQKLDYLKDLGVETLWLSPIFKSPNDDNGYDVSDYCDIMDEFGNMDDFDEMLAEMKKRGMRLVLDLVANHSSDEHHWFQEAKKSKDNPYRDYYIWREANPDGSLPNNWQSIFEGPAWEYNEATDDYYLHLFTRKQPDLNWENPKLRKEIYDIMHFWFKKGIDGFRMDVIPFISKREGLPDVPYNDNEPAMISQTNWYANGPRLHEFLHEMHEEVLKHYDCMSVGEGIGVGPDDGVLYVDPERKELNMVYYFDHIYSNRDFKEGGLKDIDWIGFKKIIRDWDEAIPEEKGWNTFYLGNHDQVRSVSCFGNDKEYRVESAKMLATMLLTLRVTPYVYQGEELGMTNTPFSSVEELNDVWILNEYEVFKENGGSEEDFLKHVNTASREHARTPFLWNDKEHAGFTTGKPWLKVNPNYTEINAVKAQQDPGSVFNFYKELIKLRKDHKGLIYGLYNDLTPDSQELFVFSRKGIDGNYLILLNLTDKEKEYVLPSELGLGKLLIGNYEGNNFNGRLKPYQAMVFEIVA